ncbi:MAG: cytochrome b562 [bacterium]
MKRNHLLSLLLLASGGLLHAEVDSALENQMKILARGTRQLSQQVSDPARQQSTITLIENLKKAALDSKTLDPRKTSEIPEEKRAQFLADFRTELDELKDTFDQIEEAVRSGQYEKAKSLLAIVSSIKKEGHGKFKAD